jgi:hypothetical protein
MEDFTFIFAKNKHMKNPLVFVRTFLIMIAIAAAIISISLIVQNKETIERGWAMNQSYGKTISFDSGSETGAAGFAILSGLALVALAITFIGKEH